MKKLSCFLSLGLLIQLNLFGQDSTRCNSKYFTDALLDKLVGQWKLTGKIGSRKTENNFSAEWILKHQFIELNFVDPSSPPNYTARVSIGYDCISERYVMHWLDNFGGRVSESLGYGLKNGNTIEFRFEYPDGPFINKLIYDDKNDNWQLQMTTKNEKGDWVVFGDEFLIRK